MTLPEGIKAVGNIIACYPNGGTQVDERYVAALGAALCGHPRSVAAACADPRTGIITTCRFLPTVADIIAWCEPRTSSMYAADAYQFRIAAQIADREEPAERTKHLSYDELNTKYGDGRGGWGIDAEKRKRSHQWLSIGDLTQMVGADAWSKIPNRR